MIRVRRSCIRPLPPAQNANARPALGCTLLLTCAEEPRPSPGIAILFPDSDADACAQAAEQAAQLAIQAYGVSMFALWRTLRDGMAAWAKKNNRCPKASRFGLALIERAIIDGLCRAWRISVREAVVQNRFGLDLGELCKPLQGSQPRDLLSPRLGKAGTALRLLVTDADCAAPDPLLAAIEQHAIARLSLSLTGEVDQDVGNLCTIANLIAASGRRLGVSLEGGGAFAQPGDLRRLFERLRENPLTHRLAPAIEFIEQPFPVDATFTNAAVAVFAEWPERPPMLVDEADENAPDASRALEWGYSGAVFRGARGLIPAIAFACLLGARREREPVGKWTFAGGPIEPDCPMAALQEAESAQALGLETLTAPRACFGPPTEPSYPEAWLKDLRDEHRAILAETRLTIQNGALSRKCESLNLAQS